MKGRNLEMINSRAVILLPSGRLGCKMHEELQKMRLSSMRIPVVWRMRTFQLRIEATNSRMARYLRLLGHTEYSLEKMTHGDLREVISFPA